MKNKEFSVRSSQPSITDIRAHLWYQWEISFSHGFHGFSQIWLHVICVHLCHLWGIFLSHGFVFLAAANALGIGAASFWSVAEKDRAESPTA